MTAISKLKLHNGNMVDMKQLFILSILLLSFISGGNTRDALTVDTHLRENQHTTLDRSEQLITIGADGIVWSINKFTGEKEWSFNTGSPMFTFKCHSADLDPFLLIPSSSGHLFTFSDGSLQNIGTTIQELVAGSPLHTQDGSFWMASKSMNMWALDVKGKEIHSWSTTNPLEATANEWNEEDILVLVRVTYNLQAIDPLSGGLKWNISVSEFTAIPSEKTNRINEEILDPVIISSDGIIYLYNENTNNFQYKTKLSSGIVTTYEISKSKGGDGFGEHWRLQGPPKIPILPPNLAMNLPSEDSRFPGIFIGINEGSLYAIPVSSAYEPEIFDHLIDTLPQSHYPAIDDGIDDDGTNKILNNLDFIGEDQLHNNNKKPNSLISIHDFKENKIDSNCSPGSIDFPYCLLGFNPISKSINEIYGISFPSDISTYPAIESKPYQNLIIENGNNNNDDSFSWVYKINYLIVFNTSWIICVFIIIIIYFYIKNKKQKEIILQNKQEKQLQIEKEKQKQKEEEKKQKEKQEKKRKKQEKMKNEKSSITTTNRTHPPLAIGNLHVDEIILGYGSSGTIVYKGTLDGRTVAIKRMLREYFDIASKEIKMLQSSDEHPNVVRYYTHAKDENFIYLALSYCSMNLDQFLQSKLSKKSKKIQKTTKIIFTKQMLFDVVHGLSHIHSMNIIHRDLKPHNILIDPKGVLKISDMGLAKKLDHGENSFSTQSSTGTLGWQAPEQMDLNARQSTKIDIFALGCIIFYCLTEGKHPFGIKTQREHNILTNNYSLDGIHDQVAKHLIEKMIIHSPKDRICINTVKNHPFFWSSEKTLDFLRLASDRLESEKVTQPIVVAIESKSHIILGCFDWLSKLGNELRNELQTSRFRKYKGNKVRDLLRVIRNKNHHYRDLPVEMRNDLGDLPDGFLCYWTNRFPHLLINTYEVILQFCPNEPNFRQFFG